MSQAVTFQILLLITFVFSSIQHECTHDKIETDFKINHPSYSMYSAQEGRILMSYNSINILIDTTTLTGVSASFSDYIISSIMPAVKNYIEATLKVPPRTGNLKAGNFTTLCSGDIIVPALYNTEGVDADLVLFVRAVDDTKAPYVASASACLLDTTTNRPIIGRMNYNVAKMAPTTNDAQREQHIVTTLHELTHVLGFSSGLYPYYINPDTRESLTGHVFTKAMFGLNTTVVNLAPLTARLKKYFNCSSIEGAYMENQGGVGSAGSHFERRIFYNEFMTASSLVDSRISQFTLALLEGTGWYQINYNMADSMTWGKNKGCSFINGPCVDSKTENVNFNEFCPTLLQTTCSWTNRAGSSCGAFNLQVQPNLPSAMNWWENNTISQDAFSDNCPIRIPYGDMDCEDPDNAAGATIQGETYAYGSKCFMATLYPHGKLKTPYPYCFKSQCKTDLAGEFYIDLTVGSSNVTCTSASQVSVPGYSGVVNCPDPVEFCSKQASEGVCRRGCTGKGSCVNQTCVCEEGWAGYDCSKKVNPTKPTSSLSTAINQNISGTAYIIGSIGSGLAPIQAEDESTLIKQKTSPKSIFISIFIPIVGLLALVGLIFLVKYVRKPQTTRMSRCRMPQKLTVCTQRVSQEVTVCSNLNSPNLLKRPFNLSSSNQDSPILFSSSKLKTRLYSPSIFKNIVTPSRTGEEGHELGIKLTPIDSDRKPSNTENKDIENPDGIVVQSFLQRLEQPDSEQTSPQKSMKDDEMLPEGSNF